MDRVTGEITKRPCGRNKAALLTVLTFAELVLPLAEVGSKEGVAESGRCQSEE